MDCDYTPEKAALAKRLKLEARMKRKGKKKLLSATQVISSNQNAEKPVFDKKLHKTFQNYLDEYYSMDCEDFIGDLPCRFKYRQVIPNSFGLTVEEILAADDKELDQWCSISNIRQIRPENVEKYDVKAYKLKAKNEELKRRILSSLYKSDDVNKEDDEAVTAKKKKRKKRKKKKPSNINEMSQVAHGKEIEANSEVNDNKRKHETEDVADISANGTNHDEQPKRKKLKSKGTGDKEICKKNNEPVSDHKLNGSECLNGEASKKKKKKGKKVNENKFVQNSINKTKSDKFRSPKVGSGKKKTSSNISETIFNDISDVRLQAFGIKPKKFRNKLKYGNVKNK